ncbi:hypothetical protein M8C21_014500 [Ambrosia artemisiifolia]|uniref:Uncharacterized protein n=1 Tax=Ambrosia artemisiifolia TaxID=4212 RepID=A0AAD5D8R7_AMBAR|nr:hypothetical protein M8C21_014500 [Ambrosia artemisiifolia]
MPISHGMVAMTAREDGSYCGLCEGVTSVTKAREIVDGWTMVVIVTVVACGRDWGGLRLIYIRPVRLMGGGGHLVLLKKTQGTKKDSRRHRT